MGYHVTSASQLNNDDSATATAKYFLSNGLNSTKLASYLAEANEDDAAYVGFRFIIFHALWTTQGNRASRQELLRRVRRYLFQ